MGEKVAVSKPLKTGNSNKKMDGGKRLNTNRKKLERTNDRDKANDTGEHKESSDTDNDGNKADDTKESEPSDTDSDDQPWWYKPKSQKESTHGKEDLKETLNELELER